MQLFPSNKKIQLVLFFAFAAIIVAVFKAPESTSPGKPQVIASTTSDYYMKDYRVITANAQGIAESWIDGSELIHFPDNSTRIINPKVKVRNKKNEIWSTEAQKGHIRDGNEITLDGTVQIQQVNKQIKINTESLIISLDKRTATSNDQIEVSDPATRLTATGLFFDFENNKVKLLSDVKAHYVTH